LSIISNINIVSQFIFIFLSLGWKLFNKKNILQILLMSEEIAPQELDFFLRFPTAQHISSPVEFLSNSSWSGVRSLSTKDEFRYF